MSTVTNSTRRTSRAGGSRSFAPQPLSSVQSRARPAKPPAQLPAELATDTRASEPLERPGMVQAGAQAAPPSTLMIAPVV